MIVEDDSQLLSFAKMPVKLSSYRGQVVLLDLWETSCAPCISSMPRVQELRNQYQTLAVYGVLMDPGNLTRAQGILQHQEVFIPIWWAPNQ